MNQNTYHHGDLRNALLEGAYTMLSEGGIHHLSLRAVAKRIGVSHNAPYQHFPDKEALIAALSHQGFDKLSAEIDDALDRLRDESVIDRLLAVAQSYVQFMARHPAYLEVMFGPYPHQDYPGLSDAALASFNRLVSLIELGQSAGEIKAQNPREIAAAIWMMLHGVSTLFRPGKIPTDIVAQRDPAQMASVFVQIVCDGIRA
jgi:AcrR family transcriptional regulator